MSRTPTEDTLMDSVTTKPDTTENDRTENDRTEHDTANAVEPTTPTLPVDQRPGATGEALTRQIDALSLAQALVDFEMANARVLDLTARLVEANERVVRFGRKESEAVDAMRVAEARASAASDAERALGEATVALIATNEELVGVRSDLTVLLSELDGHRAVIAARDRDAADLHREIAARDEIVRTRTDELNKVRGSLTFRVASKLTSVVRRRR